MRVIWSLRNCAGSHVNGSVEQLPCAPSRRHNLQLFIVSLTTQRLSLIAIQALSRPMNESNDDGMGAEELTLPRDIFL